LSSEVITIEVTEWDQIEALERCIYSLTNAMESCGDEELEGLFQHDIACLLLLREELKDAVDCYTEPSRPN
jgi:hypothetical protein